MQRNNNPHSIKKFKKESVLKRGKTFSLTKKKKVKKPSFSIKRVWEFKVLDRKTALNSGKEKKNKF